jgi:hypothetical protein
MRTPAGTECPFYFEDFHRGRERQECRLIERTPSGGIWEPSLCQGCRVPAITRANACPHLVLEARVVKSGFLGLGKKVEASAMCTRSLEDVPEPEVGCGQCHLDLPPLSTAPELP